MSGYVKVEAQSQSIVVTLTRPSGQTFGGTITTDTVYTLPADNYLVSCTINGAECVGSTLGVGDGSETTIRPSLTNIQQNSSLSTQMGSLTTQMGTVAASVPVVERTAAPLPPALPLTGSSASVSASDHVHPGPLWASVDTGLITLPRNHLDDSVASSLTVASGTEHFTFFRANRGISVSQVTFMTGSVAIVLNTLAKVGLYSVDVSGNMTLVLSSTNKTAFTGGNTANVVAFTSSATLTLGATYAVGLVQVGTTIGSYLGGYSPVAVTGNTVPLAAIKTSAGDLLSSTTLASLTPNSFPVYYELR